MPARDHPGCQRCHGSEDASGRQHTDGPGSGLGNEAWVDGCGSNVAFRLGRLVGEVTTYTDDVVQGSGADTRRTASIARKAVKRLRKLRCPPSFCRGT